MVFLINLYPANVEIMVSS